MSISTQCKVSCELPPGLFERLHLLPEGTEVLFAAKDPGNIKSWLAITRSRGKFTARVVRRNRTIVVSDKQEEVMSLWMSWAAGGGCPEWVWWE